MPVETFKASATKLKDGLSVETATRGFKITIDEPVELGGTNYGMNPVELVLCALGACQTIVAKVYAEKFHIQFDEFRVELEGDLDTDGFMNVSNVRPGYSEIRYKIHIKTDATSEKVEEFIRFIEKTCPVGDTLSNPVRLVSSGFVIEN